MRIFIFKICLFLFLSAAMGGLSYADIYLKQHPDIQNFIKLMVKKHGFNEQKLNELFTKVNLLPEIIKKRRSAVEQLPTWEIYQKLFIHVSRIQNGYAFWKKNAYVLCVVEKKFGVPASIIVATIGIESNYGRELGKYRVIDALTTQAFSHTAFDPIFYNELEEFLLLTREQNIDPLSVVGSYSGAIGQMQFMPSSFRRYAMSFSKNAKIDPFHNEADVIISIANYYKQHGWQPNALIAVQAVMIGDRYNYLIKNNLVMPPFSVAELISLGVIPKIMIEPDTLSARVIELPTYYGKEYWLVFRNFEVIMFYNMSDYYAIAVYQLSDLIKEEKEKSKETLETCQ